MKNAPLPSEERILNKAAELFYRQGYQATGINQIIDESGVAKATFYANFPSKDELCVLYLRRTSQKEFDLFKSEISKHKKPTDRFMCAANLVISLLKESDFKGCPFLNMVPEVVDPNHPIRKEASKFYKAYESLIKTVTEELIASDKTKYGRLKAEVLAKQYMTIFAGGITLSSLHHSVEPMKTARDQIEALIKT